MKSPNLLTFENQKTFQATYMISTILESFSLLTYLQFTEISQNSPPYFSKIEKKKSPNHLILVWKNTYDFFLFHRIKNKTFIIRNQNELAQILKNE